MLRDEPSSAPSKALSEPLRCDRNANKRLCGGLGAAGPAPTLAPTSGADDDPPPPPASATSAASSAAMSSDCCRFGGARPLALRLEPLVEPPLPDADADADADANTDDDTCTTPASSSNAPDSDLLEPRKNTSEPMFAKRSESSSCSVCAASGNVCCCPASRDGTGGGPNEGEEEDAGGVGDPDPLNAARNVTFPSEELRPSCPDCESGGGFCGGCGGVPSVPDVATPGLM